MSICGSLLALALQTMASQEELKLALRIYISKTQDWICLALVAGSKQALNADFFTWSLTQTWLFVSIGTQANTSIYTKMHLLFEQNAIDVNESRVWWYPKSFKVFVQSIQLGTWKALNWSWKPPLNKSCWQCSIVTFVTWNGPICVETLWSINHQAASAVVVGNLAFTHKTPEKLNYTALLMHLLHEKKYSRTRACNVQCS